MSDRPYSIRSDPAERLVTIGFDSVFWPDGVAERFAADCIAAVTRLDCPPGTHRILVDLRNAVLQSQEVIGRMQMLIGGATAERIALVAVSPLARMQTKRLRIRDGVMLFGEIGEAQAWLGEPPERAAA